MRVSKVSRVLLAALLVTGATLVHAQGPVMVGPRVAYNFDFEEAAIGGHLMLPLNSRIDFYPSIDIFLPDNGSLLGLNADLRLHPLTRETAMIYGGGGLNLTRASFRGESNTDAGVNLFAGLEGRTGVIRPFGELRLILGDGSSVQLVGGLNIVLGNR